MDADAPIINQTVRYGVICPMSGSEVNHAIQIAGGTSADPSLTFYRQYVGDGAPREGWEDKAKAEWLANDYLGGVVGRAKARVVVITSTIERYPDGKIIETRVTEVA